MLNTIVIGKDLNYCTCLINYLSKNNNLGRITIGNKIEEITNIVQPNTNNIILINTENVRYNQIFENELLKNYLDSIILICNNLSKHELENLQVYACVNENKNFEHISELVAQLLNFQKNNKCFLKENEDRKSLIKKIEQELIFLNMEVLYNGVRYLIDAVYILYNLENYYDNNLEKDIYPIIAKKYHKTVNNIKSNINYTVNLIYAGCEEEKLLDYLEEYSICKPTPKKIIFSILEKIQRK